MYFFGVGDEGLCDITVRVACADDQDALIGEGVGGFVVFGVGPLAIEVTIDVGVVFMPVLAYAYDDAVVGMGLTVIKGDVPVGGVGCDEDDLSAKLYCVA